jgi:hypothetical protein
MTRVYESESVAFHRNRYSAHHPSSVGFRWKRHLHGGTYPRLVSIDDYESDIARRAHLHQAERETLLRASLESRGSVAGPHASLMVTDRPSVTPDRGQKVAL